MNEAIERMLSEYNVQTDTEAQHALREIVQEIALYGLWDGGFFREAAFYGGTALRILYGLDRYSEDMDFSLLAPNENFSFERYRKKLTGALEDMGFNVDFEVNDSPGKNNIWSAFLKGNTLNQMMSIGIPETITGRIHSGQKLKVKIEVDVDPAPGFDTEFLPALNPIPHNVQVYDLKNLFTGKMHALLCRGWGDRVKGRDWYDTVWYLQKKVSVYIPYLEAKMRQSGHWEGPEPLTEGDILDRYREKAENLDIQKALVDVEDFLKDPSAVRKAWSNQFFLGLARYFKFEN